VIGSLSCAPFSTTLEQITGSAVFIDLFDDIYDSGVTAFNLIRNPLICFSLFSEFIHF
jgi:hypothetical protein